MNAFRKVKDRGFTTRPDIILGILLKHCSCILLLTFSTRAGIVGFTHRQLHHPEKTLFLPRQWKKLGNPENPLCSLWQRQNSSPTAAIRRVFRSDEG